MSASINFVSKNQQYKIKFLKFDIASSIVLFLITIPLCLGIALASGAPLFSGLTSAIIGGIIVGLISGSNISVTGPTPGMTALTIVSIAQLGDFNTFLLALCFAGIVQIFLGIIRAGFIAEYLPYSVIQGALCAIGILLIIKLLPFTFSMATNLFEMKSNLLEMTEAIKFNDVFAISYHLNTGAILISVITVAILIYFDKNKIKRLFSIPGPLIAIIFAILLNELFILSNSRLAQITPQLINLPNYDGIFNLISQIPHPDWSKINNPQIYFIGIFIGLVASMESLVSIKAIEKLKKNRHYLSTDRELLSQGTGNFISGLFGGLPMTAAIIQTSINLEAGAKTKFATIFHGFLILFTILFIPETLNRIPVCSLATILIYTGYKLTDPKIYIGVSRQGLDRFLPFLATVIGIVIFNVMFGLILGLLFSLFFILKSNSETRFDIIQEVYPNGITNRLILPQQTTFLNKASLAAELESIPKDSQLTIDARYSNFIDKEVIEFLKTFKEELAPHRNISLNLIGFKKNYDLHNYIDFINVTTYDVQASLTPSRVLTILKEGNLRFLKDTRLHRSVQTDIKYTAKTQHPIAVVLGCIDSRVPVETIFDMSFGDLFCIRVAGNVVNNDILASIEYASAVAGAKLIVVLGHTRCGAIQAASDNVIHGHITELLNKIKPAITAETKTQNERNSKNQTFIQNVTNLNVANTIDKIYRDSEILRNLIDTGDCGLTGAIYDVNTGEVDFKNFSNEILQLDPKLGETLNEKLQSLVKSTQS